MTDKQHPEPARGGREELRERIARIVDPGAFAPIVWIAGEEQMKARHERDRQDAFTKADAILALSPPPDTAPDDGWVLVPREPTMDMRVAGAIAWGDTDSERPISDAYRAMIAAAPPPPESSAVDGDREA